MLGCAHHLTQRGNNRQPVFSVDDHGRVYLEMLREQAEGFGKHGENMGTLPVFLA